MTVHDGSSELGRRTCDALLAAFQARDPSAYCRHAANMCAFGVGAGPNFAYALHRKKAGGLDIYFPSTGTDRFEPFAGIEPLLRRTLGSDWADNWAWHFLLESPASAPDAATFLLRFARTARRTRRVTPAGSTPLAKKGTDGRDLGLKDDHDVEMIRQSSDLPMKRLHNRMTNALLLLAGSFYTILEGIRPEAQFDALIQQYNEAGNDLLLEVKTSVNVPDVRLAMGQLLDYRRFLERPNETHLGILLPERPPGRITDFVGSVNHLLGRQLVTLYWFPSPARLGEIWSSLGRFLPQEGA